MNIEENIWQITEFTEKIQKTYKEITGEESTVHLNTINTWFNDLEKKKVHYIQRVADKKVYDKMDLNVAITILNYRSKKWRLEAIMNILSTETELRSFPEEFEESNQDVNQTTQEIIIREISGKMKILKEELKKEILSEIGDKDVQKEVENYIENFLPAPADSTDVIKESLTLRLELEEEALAEWDAKPIEERTIKVGWIKRIEDTRKKDSFIRNYLKNKLATEVKSE